MPTQDLTGPEGRNLKQGAYLKIPELYKNIYFQITMIRRSKSIEEINRKEDYNPFIPPNPIMNNNNTDDRSFYLTNGTFIDLMEIKRKDKFTRIKSKKKVVNRITWHEESNKQYVKQGIENIVLVGMIRKKFPFITTIKNVIEIYVNKEMLRPRLDNDLMDFYLCLAIDNLEKAGWLVTNRKDARQLAANDVDFSCDIPKITKFYILMNVLRLKQEGKILGIH